MRRWQRTVGRGGAPGDAGAPRQQECCTVHSNWLQLTIGDTKTGTENLFLGVGLVTSSWGEVHRRGHREGCWKDGHPV